MQRLKKYLEVRYKKYQFKYSAEIYYIEKIFTKWNSLYKKRVILK